MQRYFNTEGSCDPKKHYMVNLEKRLELIKNRYVERGSYLVINRGRQYGKTTTLKALADYLTTEYIVVSMDFQMLSTKNFEDESMFSKAFARMFITPFYTARIENTEELLKQLSDFIQREQNLSLDELFLCLSKVCSMAPRPVVLLIDEVDHASNHPVFIDFLAMLRGYYLNRENMAAFHSVILAGVYDIKNLKLKIRPGTEHRYNSPWNIGARFNIDMSFTAAQIAAMLKEYENDQRIVINPKAIAEEIYHYTSGYPYLVSSICKWLDEELPGNERFEEKADAWTKEGVMTAVKGLLDERIPLFESMIRQLDEYPEMKHMLHAILFEGRRVIFGFLRYACTTSSYPRMNLQARLALRQSEIRVSSFVTED